MGVTLAIQRDDVSAKEAGDSRYSPGGYFDSINPHLEPLLLPGHRRVLEVGCGSAALGGQWKAADPTREIWGVERDARAGHIAAERIDRVLCLDLDEFDGLPAGAGLFDLMVFGDVLEHLRDPGRVLAQLVPSLSEVGEIAACVPNVAHWSVMAQLLTGRFQYEDQGLLDRTHIHLFTPSSFRELLCSTGLSTVTGEQRVAVPAPVSDLLAQLGVALLDDPSRRSSLRSDFDTYQTVFRARRPVTGTLTGLVVCTTGEEPNNLANVLDEFSNGFHPDEPVRLLVGVAVEDSRLANAVDGILTQRALQAASGSVPSHVFVYDRSRPLEPQLPPGPAQYVAVGTAAASALPSVPAAGHTRIDMLRAVRHASKRTTGWQPASWTTLP